ncbi:MAG: L-2-amino-thiazoline-4-carboxylic acid hydrolase [Desulfobacterales bacterium]|nr:L-2-amino-thiazoline-4-carboxylic acid hydrolase [Desulfobacterales bacterium]
MTQAIDNIPAEIRWQIATKGLTGACVAMIGALKEALGNEKFDEFQVGLWSQAGKGAKELADAFELAADTPKALAELTNLAAMTSMGPEFKFEIVEATEDKCVARTDKCPWHERWKEFGFTEDFCEAGHQGWGDGAVKSLNPDFNFTLTMNMQRGDACCEYVIERKK